MTKPKSKELNKEKSKIEKPKKVEESQEKPKKVEESQEKPKKVKKKLETPSPEIVVEEAEKPADPEESEVVEEKLAEPEEESEEEPEEELEDVTRDWTLLVFCSRRELQKIYAAAGVPWGYSYRASPAKLVESERRLETFVIRQLLKAPPRRVGKSLRREIENPVDAGL